ncbi:hypothetical protein DPMN_105114 [Dreissena polymorpha]|uniref:Ig-like domain-containing protein n=1 Tax=Dreissena polymorpha TaxID=45954 RepID=A0A9D4HGE5_DREPO|nr:hypothetical protein DPMN_105114 [Dreissena polymorpha]
MSADSASDFDFFDYFDMFTPAPRITNAPKNMKVAENLIVSFFCKASGHPAPDLTWEKDGKPINPINRKRYDIWSMPHGTVLRVASAKSKRDDTVLTCVATNEKGEARANATLEVYAADSYPYNFDNEADVAKFYAGIPQGYPRIDINPQLSNVEKGLSATMECQASAADMERPTIYWLKDHLPIDISDTRITINTENDGNLIIEQAQERDIGKYECVAENEIGVAYSSAAMLYVKVRRVPPHFSVPPAG